MPGERSAEDIQRDIESSRAELAKTIDQLAYRTSPTRVSENVKTSLREPAQSPVGQAVLGTTAVVVVVLVVRRVRKARTNKKRSGRAKR